MRFLNENLSRVGWELWSGTFCLASDVDFGPLRVLGCVGESGCCVSCVPCMFLLVLWVRVFNLCRLYFSRFHRSLLGLR